MPTSNDAAPRAASPELWDALREWENPFNDFVHAPVGGRARDVAHVPEINGDAQQKLCAAVARYRRCELPIKGWEQPGPTSPSALGNGATPAAPDVPYSGLVLVLGKRGAGKTHLLSHGMTDRQTGGLMVSPRQFEPRRPFAEYVWHQLLLTLQAEPTQRSTLVQLADWWARRVVTNAFASFSDPDWIAWLVHAQPHWRGWRTWLSPALSWWGETLRARRQEWVVTWQDASFPTLHEAAIAAELPLESIRQLAESHILRCQPTNTIGDQLRQRLYLQLIAAACTREPGPLLDFLVDGYAELESAALASRGTQVEELLQGLADLLLLFGRPVILAFDALETLLGQPPEPERCERFHSGLAELLDRIPGLPAFVFAESGYWQLIQKHFSEYAVQRWQRGIPVRRAGTISRLVLPELDRAAMNRMVAARLQPLLRRSLGRDPVESERYLPFAEQDLASILGDRPEPPPLRQVLLALRDRYEKLVFGGPDEPDGPRLAVPPAQTYGALWPGCLRESERRIEDCRGQWSLLCDDFYSGMRLALAALRAAESEIDGWQLREVEVLPSGTHPTYGQYVSMVWQQGTTVARLGVSLLLGSGSGLPKDLKTKLAMVQGSRPDVAQLRVLWPRDQDSHLAAWEQLPPATRELWERAMATPAAGRIELQVISPLSLAPWLAVGAMQRRLGDGPSPAAASDDRASSEQIVSQLRAAWPLLLPAIEEATAP